MCFVAAFARASTYFFVELCPRIFLPSRKMWYFSTTPLGVAGAFQVSSTLLGLRMRILGASSGPAGGAWSDFTAVALLSVQPASVQASNAIE